MKFIETPICGLWLIELEPTFDERGFFARSFCEDEFRRIGLVEKFPQQNVSFNAQAGIIRGLHFQKSPYEEIKTVRCVRGEIFDVTVDLRPESASFGKTFCHILKKGVYQTLYIPQGCAHGYQVLKRHSEVLYSMSTTFKAQSASGILWSSPCLNISWPLSNPFISENDNHWPIFEQGT